MCNIRKYSPSSKKCPCYKADEHSLTIFRLCCCNLVFCFLSLYSPSSSSASSELFRSHRTNGPPPPLKRYLHFIICRWREYFIDSHKAVELWFPGRTLCHVQWHSNWPGTSRKMYDANEWNILSRPGISVLVGYTASFLVDGHSSWFEARMHVCTTTKPTLHGANERSRRRFFVLVHVTHPTDLIDKYCRSYPREFKRSAQSFSGRVPHMKI